MGVVAYLAYPLPLRLPSAPQLDGHHVGPDGRELQPPAMFLCPITQVRTCRRGRPACLGQLRSCCGAASPAPETWNRTTCSCQRDRNAPCVSVSCMAHGAQDALIDTWFTRNSRTLTLDLSYRALQPRPAVALPLPGATQEVMSEPVVASDGFTYERAAIGKWLSAGKKTSPMTNLPFASRLLFPNNVIKTAIKVRGRSSRRCTVKVPMAWRGSLPAQGCLCLRCFSTGGSVHV